MSKPFWDPILVGRCINHFGVGEFTTHLRVPILVVGLVDVHGGLGQVTPVDFAAYMRFHHRRLFREAFAPTPFCSPIRRSQDHDPEGSLGIEEMGETIQPICTSCCRGKVEMKIPLNASTQVSFTGEAQLHAYLGHQFSSDTGAKLSLVARARQFSSFIVLLGHVTSATGFEAKHAVLLQNKDELQIPLDLATIPTPKEFKDAIESLSPEQQRFAKAFRAMQLESTLFGIVVVQIKPQLERLLNLPEESLTKEIKLTQDLMQLFIQYQIPSDLLSFAPLGVPGVPATQVQLQTVRQQAVVVETGLGSHLGGLVHHPSYLFFFFFWGGG